MEGFSSIQNGRIFYLRTAMRIKTISIISVVIVFLTLDVLTSHAKKVTNVREDKNLSAMAKKLLGDRLFERWKIKVWVSDAKEMGEWLGGSNPNGDIVINSKYIGIPDDEMALLLGHEIAHVILSHDRGLLRKHFSKRSVFETFSEPLLEYYYVKFSREQEFAADEWALKLLINAKYNPNKALNLYRKLAKEEGILKKMTSKIVEDPSFSERLKKLEDIFYADEPPIPYEDYGACPFEGCVYREWTVLKETPIYKDRDKNSPIVFIVKRGEWVTAITGTVITTKPGKVEVLNDTFLEDIGKVHKGDMLYLLTYGGEGFWKVWYKGKLFTASFPIITGPGEWMREESKDFRLIQENQSVWWVRIKNKIGEIGWTNKPDNFGNKDLFD